MKKQKVWLVTGASRGFGLEIVKAALDAGDKVVATVRSNPEKLQAQLNNENLFVTVLDVTNEPQAKEVANLSTEKFGRIDVLVNNAGFGLLSAVEEASNTEVKANYEANVFGLLNVTRGVLPFMRKERKGHIINLSSVGGLTGIIGWGLYGSTKFAVEGITEALSKELAPLGIYATAVEPGFFRTDFLDQSSLTRSANSIEDYAETVGDMRSYATQVNQKQPGSAEKLAQAILKIADAEKPPVHLPLGKDTLQLFKEKMDKFNADIEAWHEVITGTDHDDVVA
ncbi:short-chain dehydrogenase/reductase SDR [Leadbetterella byssophila DSM 17132]|uniref:Short-chain dehydrogenase/reductase SDR n=1 Tax=Leadbetterella byssophila (strain DSM 17132 / JCM 16389 / KACC 11308 / NBRC 106382 / 4M15) TaxID=649349 RepID=E4RTI1_LEAB4|nr:oxidoreductase [Leadbetterella byssophila]ADQ15995.1 short-chain dehydrogenase/reductase SDR [Leadbetterella byssophila DSM 17132]